MRVLPRAGADRGHPRPRSAKLIAGTCVLRPVRDQTGLVLADQAAGTGTTGAQPVARSTMRASTAGSVEFSASRLGLPAPW